MTDKILIDRTVAQQALKALQNVREQLGSTVSEFNAIEAIRAALEQPQGKQEPVARVVGTGHLGGHFDWCKPDSQDYLPPGELLYTHPHHRQPLNDDEILHTGIPEQLWFAKRFGSAPAGWTDEQIRTHNFFQSAVTQLVRAIERAHGITGE